jgi:hypothetical protein
MKRLLTLFVVLTFTVSWAHAQILESILFGLGNSLVNNEIAKKGTTTQSSGKIMFDVFHEGRFTNVTWDSTTQTSVFVVDGLDFVVKPFKNGPPPRDITVYINDARYERRKVEGDKGGKGIRGKGVIGGYPMIASEDLPYGAVQVKVRFSKTEWAQATFIRVRSVRDVLATMADDKTRQALYGFGGATFPSVPSFLAQLPNGSVRSFLSMEELQQTLATFQGGTVQAELPGEAQQKLPVKGGEQDVDTQQEKTGSWNGCFRFGYYKNSLNETVLEKLKAQREYRFAKDSHLIPANQKLAIFLSDSKPFGVSLADQNGKVVSQQGSQKVGDRYELLIGIPTDFAGGVLAVATDEKNISFLSLER